MRCLQTDYSTGSSGAVIVALYHFLLFMVIGLVSHGDFLFPFFDQGFSVTAMMLRGAVCYVTVGSALQSRQQLNDLLRYLSSIRIRMANTVDTIAEPMNVSGVQRRKISNISSPSARNFCSQSESVLINSSRFFPACRFSSRISPRIYSID